MEFHADALTPKRIPTDQLLLDANNPRFAELGDDLTPVAEQRFNDAKVQQAAMQKMRSSTFEVAELRDTIRRLGFLPMDRLVVRPWRGGGRGDEPRYVVIEGNRRLTAIRWLLELHDTGKDTLSDDELASLSTLECLVLNENVAPDRAAVILPGLRHISGIKPWGPYQKAKAIYGLRRDNMSAAEVAQSLGMTVRAVNLAYKTFRALEQMKEDEEFGQLADPKLYSFFEEVLKKQNVRDWLGWDDAAEGFANQERRQEFYTWITEGPDGEKPKIPMAINIRELSKVIDDEDALAALRTDGGSLVAALAKHQVENPGDWKPKLLSAINALKTLTPDMLRNMSDDVVGVLESLHKAIDQALEDRKKLSE